MEQHCARDQLTSGGMTLSPSWCDYELVKIWSLENNILQEFIIDEVILIATYTLQLAKEVLVCYLVFLQYSSIYKIPPFIITPFAHHNDATRNKELNYQTKTMLTLS